MLETDAGMVETGPDGIAGKAIRVLQPVQPLLFGRSHHFAVPNEYRRRVVKKPLGQIGHDFTARQREAAIQSEGIQDSPLDGGEKTFT
ncbi:hypothetical protein AB0L33_05085 [Streptomyces sp. NPDC052299]|uniref:hypothetical protein n=1 Tax=Streptomyces sp. NPDC052299 TaxID=3155054 RepID=UPI0034394800